MHDFFNIFVAYLLDGVEAEVGDVHLLALNLVKDKVKKRLCLDASHLNDLLLSEPTKLGTLELSEGLVEGRLFHHIRLK